MLTEYNPAEIEPKWQKIWEEKGLNKTDIAGAKRPFYNLWMFPYPSAEGLHVGHAFASTASDIYGRFKRFQGFDVFQPIGYDSFGIHSENFALKIGEHPKKFTDRAIKNYERQLRAMGHMYDWSRTVTTSDPNYYKWTQWIFLQIYKAGLAYRGKATVNFCPKCKTVLSDEQVIDGACERCKTIVAKKEMEQWFFKITAFADRLLKNLDNLDWTTKIKLTQKNWIGKKMGVLVNFSAVEIFTTRIDTILGATFVVLSPNHPLANKIKTVVNPVTKKEIPVFVDEYVLDSVGTGAIMGVPAFDERDMTFAKKHNLPILTDFELVLDIKIGKEMVIYHLRDWLISRQRYWGAPIPMINCAKCGWVAVPEKDLPILLPEITDYQPEGNGRGPLANHPEFYQTKCSKCGGEATRETDVCDTFLDSSWYELRYPSTGSFGSDQAPFDAEITKKWLPVNMYMGGAEHAVLHLMYFRFVTMVLKDLGYLDFEEPTKSFFAHGLIIKDRAKMSKSRGNVVNPDEYITKYGVDSLRLYFMFMGPVEQGGDFKDDGIKGMRRWLDRVYRVISTNLTNLSDSANPAIERELSKLIQKAAADFESRHYNTTIAKMMEFINLLSDDKLQMTNDQIKKFLIILAPFAPHLAEELWQQLVGMELVGATHESPTQFVSIHQQGWPKYNSVPLRESLVTIIIQINGKLRGKLENIEANLLDNQELLVEKAKQDSRVVAFLAGKSIKQVIYAKGKVLNFVCE